VLENKESEGSSSSSSTVTIERAGLDPWTLYMYAMKSPATKEKYLMRIGKFLDFLNLQEGGQSKINQEPLPRKEEMTMYGRSITPSSLYNYSECVDR
jgi:hypothetical protein